MKAKVDALLTAYPSIDVTAMGFPRESTGGQTPCEQGKSLGVFKDCLLDERDFASRNRNAFGAKLHDELHAS